MLSAVLTGARRPWAAVWHLGIPGLDPGYVALVTWAERFGPVERTGWKAPAPTALA